MKPRANTRALKRATRARGCMHRRELIKAVNSMNRLKLRNGIQAHAADCSGDKAMQRTSVVYEVDAPQVGPILMVAKTRRPVALSGLPAYVWRSEDMLASSHLLHELLRSGKSVTCNVFAAELLRKRFSTPGTNRMLQLAPRSARPSARQIRSRYAAFCRDRQGEVGWTSALPARQQKRGSPLEREMALLHRASGVAMPR